MPCITQVQGTNSLVDDESVTVSIVGSQLGGSYRTFRLGSPSYRQSEQSLMALCAPQDAHARSLFVFAAAADVLEALPQCALCGSEGRDQCCS